MQSMNDARHTMGPHVARSLSEGFPLVFGVDPE
jgi:hypothetical protein